MVTAVGVTLAATAPRPAPAPRTGSAASISGWLAPGGGGIGLHGAFR